MHSAMRSKLLPAGLAVLATFVLSCQSSGPNPDPEGSVYRAPEAAAPASIGFFLSNYDKSLRRWTELKHGPGNARDMRTLRALEANLKKRAVERQDELVGVVENGAPAARGTAAVAIGFTRDPSLLSPLLAALSDPSQDVVQNALLGIGILQVPETPMAHITALLGSGLDRGTRNNAAYAIQCLVSVGARDPLLADACRTALIDEEPGVRGQAASILGMLHDAESISYLGDLLQDEFPFPVRAAMTSLVRIGRQHAEQKGRVARLLVDAMDRVTPSLRANMLVELTLLAERNLGNDSQPWREWAYRMP